MTRSNALFRESSSGDPWGDCMSHLFGICEALNWYGADIPPEWEFRPSPIVHEVEDYPDAMYLELLESGDMTPDELIHDGEVLMRYRSMLKQAKMDY